MEQTLIEVFKSQGPWALLFVFLLIYILKMNEKREERLIGSSERREGEYQQIINKLSDNVLYELNSVRTCQKDMQEDIREIKTKVYR
ncbi:MAG: hypothetical protein VR72_03035 [Clostridiaceae bacterium BRH_c20a]|nr:MAG: hypothetical protein VR72_03035 [Clostridiaceae bacterium BRH_c20a]